MAEKNGFPLELVNITYNDTNTYSLADFSKLIPMVQTYIAEHSQHTYIDSDADYKPCWNERTALNTAKKTVENYRKKMIKFIVGEFESQCKQVEKMLDTASQYHTESINQYNGKEEKKSLKLTISCDTQEHYAMIVGFINGIPGIEIKEG